MTRENLFKAIGCVEETRLAASELTVAASSARETMEETDMYKRKVTIGRVIRNLLVAAVIISMLAVTAYAVAGWVIFDSPQEMISAVFGDKTGYDHKPVTTWTDPWKPGAVYENPAYDRVPADETVVGEDVAPHVTPVGKVLKRDGYTLTVDAYMYDSTTKSGIVTYTLEAEQGLPEYEMHPNGELWYKGIPDPVDFNQYGKTFIIQEKTTADKLAVTYYFYYEKWQNKDFTVALGDSTDMSDAERNALRQTCEAEVREQYTPAEAIAEAKRRMGEAAFTRYAGGLEEMAAYAYLTNRLYDEKSDTREKIVFDCPEDRKLDCVTAGEGAVIITPISFQLDVEELKFLHEMIEGETYIHGDNVDSVVICYRDGTEYEVNSGDVCNVVYGLISMPEDSQTGNHSQLNYMFNRVIDVDSVASVKLNGVELKVD